MSKARHTVTQSWFSVLMIAVSCACFGQEYPTKPIRVITSGVGGISDSTSRLIAQGISATLGQAIVVNLPSSVLPGQTVAQAAPDGYTLLVAGGSFTLGPLLAKTPYDPLRDFVPITLVSTAPNLLVVHPSLPVTTVRQLISLAKAKPDQLNYSSGANGSPTHLAAELFKSMTGAHIQRIPYRSGSTQMADLVGGHVQLTFGNISTVQPHVKAGRLRAIAVSSASPSALAPDLPTIALTVPGYESAAMTGLLAPLRTPDPIIRRINQEVVRYINTPDIRDRFMQAGVEPVGNSPQEYGARMKSEISRISQLIKDTGIRTE